MKSLITAILREKGCIDNGISEEIVSTIEPIIQQTIAMELNLGEMAGKAMQGLLANPCIECTNLTEEELVQCAVSHAFCLMAELDNLRNPDSAH